MNHIHNTYDNSDIHCRLLVCLGMWRNGSG